MQFLRLGFLVLALALCCVVAGPALADGIDYSITGTFTPNTLTTPATAPNASFTMTFSVPNVLTGPYPATPGAVQITYTLGAGSPVIANNSTVAFFNGNDGGLFDIMFNDGGQTFVFSLFGPQLFAGPGNKATAPFPLKTGSFGFDLANSAAFSNISPTAVGLFSSGTVTATGTSAVPEPSSMLLLGTGLLGLPFIRRRISRAA